MRYKVFVIAGFVLMGIGAWLLNNLFSSSHEKVSGSIYDFRMKTLDGATVDFEQYRGKNLLIVNTASKCGYTPQYETLQRLHETYGDRLAILGFPANIFLWQEPGSNEDI